MTIFIGILIIITDFKDIIYNADSPYAFYEFNQVSW